MLLPFRRRAALVAALSLASLTLPGVVGIVQAQDKKPLKVGVSVGSGEQIWEVVKKVAARDGLALEVVVFNDYQLPNAALAAGDLDANAFQHQPFLDNQIKARGGSLELEPTDMPWGVRVFRVKDPDGFKIAISSVMAG